MYSLYFSGTNTSRLRRHNLRRQELGANELSSNTGKQTAKVIPLLIRQPYCHHNKCRIFAFHGGRNIVKRLYGIFQRKLLDFKTIFYLLEPSRKEKLRLQRNKFDFEDSNLF